LAADRDLALCRSRSWSPKGIDGPKPYRAIHDVARRKGDDHLACPIIDGGPLRSSKQPTGRERHQLDPARTRHGEGGGSVEANHEEVVSNKAIAGGEKGGREGRLPET
jgi:hypothetical protein